MRGFVQQPCNHAASDLDLHRCHKSSTLRFGGAKDITRIHKIVSVCPPFPILSRFYMILPDQDALRHKFTAMIHGYTMTINDILIYNHPRTQTHTCTHTHAHIYIYIYVCDCIWP